MEWEFVAPMVTAVTLVLSIAGVLIFRPLTRRLGDLIEITAQNRQRETQTEELARVADLVGLIGDRLDRLEERQDFTERILQSLERSPSRAARIGQPDQ